MRLDVISISSPVWGFLPRRDRFFRTTKLPNPDKQLSILAGSAHIAPFGLNAHRFYHIMFAFLDMPERRDTQKAH